MWDWVAHPCVVYGDSRGSSECDAFLVLWFRDSVLFQLSLLVRYVSERIANPVGVASTVAAGASSLFSGLPLVLLVLCGVSLLGGAGGTIWYRMKWLDEVAAGARALAVQRDIDRADNAKAIGQLTNKLNTHQQELEYAQQMLSNIPRSNACERDQRINAARELLCRKYPKSEACSGQRPAR